MYFGQDSKRMDTRTYVRGHTLLPQADRPHDDADSRPVGVSQSLILRKICEGAFRHDSSSVSSEECVTIQNLTILMKVIRNKLRKCLEMCGGFCNFAVREWHCVMDVKDVKVVF